MHRHLTPAGRPSMKVIVQVIPGIGTPGKRWTGSTIKAGIHTALIMELSCECGATTRKLRLEEIPHTSEITRVLDLPQLLVSTGGAGSLADDAFDQVPEAALWNWSERLGGFAFLDPVAVLSGYVDEATLPEPRDPEYSWVQTYRGETLSEWVLIRQDLRGHRLPVVKVQGICPPCRRLRELESVEESLRSAVLSAECTEQRRIECPWQDWESFWSAPPSEQDPDWWAIRLQPEAQKQLDPDFCKLVERLTYRLTRQDAWETRRALLRLHTREELDLNPALRAMAEKVETASGGAREVK